jgi:hypothetical protein
MNVELKNNKSLLEEKFFESLYYHWVAKHVVTQVKNNARRNGHYRF